ncbi:unnamed protein product [Blepharisma stoltei]|uniref:RING-type domain-containing protein n=1 Tax=Blepharisma stoltei TaxID=1481888 RepID=A0AAU9IK81_9CILI|nr:unnamed protein product [Blepharisma stoltei]
MDLISLLCCQNCGGRFNTDTMVPLSLICGHTCCKACLSSSGHFTCPSDSITETREISQIPASALVLQFLQNAKPNYTCFTHSRPLEFYCVPCRKLLCPKCIMQHSLHEYMDIDQADTIVKDLKNNFDCYYSTTLDNYSKLTREIEDVKRAQELIAQSLKAAQKELKEKYNCKKEELEKKRKIEEQELEYKMRPSIRYVEEHKIKLKELLQAHEQEKENAIKTKSEISRHNSNLAVLYHSDKFDRKASPLKELNFEWNRIQTKININVKEEEEVSETGFSIEEQRWQHYYHNN